jgi:hypothetical protein
MKNALSIPTVSIFAGFPNQNGNVVLFAATDKSFDQRAQLASARGRQSMIDTGGRVDPDRDLCTAQIENMRAGYIAVRITTNIYGFCVRDTNNLGGGRMSPNFATAAEVIDWAENWYLEAPDKREVLVYSNDATKLEAAWLDRNDYDGDETCEVHEDETKCSNAALRVYREPFTPAAFGVMACGEHSSSLQFDGYHRDRQAEIALANLKRHTRGL